MARILVIDDEESVRAVIGGVLRSAGHDTVTAADGDRALDVLREPGVHVFQLVITDLVMPEHDGLETIRDIRREFPGMKIIAMSGAEQFLKSSAHVFAAREMGADDVLKKPLSPGVLFKAVDAALKASS